jgi:benzoylformate decarboxylase
MTTAPRAVRAAKSAQRSGKHALLGQLVADGISVVFGNPGTTEEGFLDALTDFPEIRYVTGLQESIVVAMADGYARTSRRPGIVQIHSAPGLGNSIAMLYQAGRVHTPLVSFACEPPLVDHAYDGFLGGDLVEFAKPVCKWATRVTHVSQLLRVWRRAVKVAMTPPQGPVFLALPMDVIDDATEEPSVPTCFVDWHSAPAPPAVAAAADLLVGAKEPLILIGDGVALSDGQEAVRSLSELLAIPVYGVDYADPSASFRDSLFMGLVGHSFGTFTRRITLAHDVVLAIATPLFPELFPSHEPYFSEGVQLIQIDLNPWEIGKNFPVSLGMQADPRLALEAVTTACRDRLSKADVIRIRARRRRWTARKQQDQQRIDERHAKLRGSALMAPSEMCETIASNLPVDCLIFDELITATDDLLHYLRPDRVGDYYLSRGGTIGIGMPSAIGAKIAHPERPVLGTTGDGSALFVIQALWTAVNQKLDVVFLVANNHMYRILKVNLLHYWEERKVQPRSFPHMDLTHPVVDFAAVAEGFGANGHHVDTPAQLADALSTAFSAGGVHLIDVRVDGSVQVESHVVRSNSGCS